MIKLKKIIEDINIPVKVGDTILVGKFKNKKMVVKDIGTDDHGMPTINGRKATTFRIFRDQSSHEDVTIDEDVIEIDGVKYAPIDS
jgi:hypothetical protein|tara:strand:+ start:1106 stop:1363 length:258 start_codon:yes stop_codon:yes gene_type:complete